MSKTIKINSERVRAFRTKRGLSQKELAGKVSVDAGTVSRWERGEIDHVRRDIFGRLCMVLGATETEICGDEPLRESSAPRQLPLRGQMNLSVNTACRNALNLVAMRYGVTRQQIVEVAPLVFYILAEQSLQQRRKRLAELQEAEVAAHRAVPPYLPYHLGDSRALDFEARSIKARDLFGTIVTENIGKPNDPDWREEKGNPFARFLIEALGASESDEVVWWAPNDAPGYAICEEEIAAIFGEDEEVAQYIFNGEVALHEMPAEVRKSSPEERAKWARAQKPSFFELDIDELK